MGCKTAFLGFVAFGCFLVFPARGEHGGYNSATVDDSSASSYVFGGTEVDAITSSPEWQAQTLSRIEKSGNLPSTEMLDQLKKSLEAISSGQKPSGPAAELAMKWIEQVEKSLPRLSRESSQTTEKDLRTLNVEELRERDTTMAEKLSATGGRSQLLRPSSGPSDTSRSTPERIPDWTTSTPYNQPNGIAVSIFPGSVLERVDSSSALANVRDPFSSVGSVFRSVGDSSRSRSTPVSYGDATSPINSLGDLSSGLAGKTDNGMSGPPSVILTPSLPEGPTVQQKLASALSGVLTMWQRRAIPEDSEELSDKATDRIRMAASLSPEAGSKYLMGLSQKMTLFSRGRGDMVSALVSPPGLTPAQILTYQLALVAAWISTVVFILWMLRKITPFNAVYACVSMAWRLPIHWIYLTACVVSWLWNRSRNR